jgi:hypothetical protein
VLLPGDTHRKTITFITAVLLPFVTYLLTLPLRSLVGKPEGRRPLGRHRSRWEDNIKMYFRDVEWGGMDWIDLAQDMDQWSVLVSTVMNLRVQ